MDNKKAAEILRAIKVGTAHAFLNDDAITSALDTAIDVLEKQERSNAQNVNSTHRARPNALESLKILESAKDENGCVPMSLVRQAFRNVLEQDRKEAYEKGLSDAWDAARKIGSELRYGLEIMGFSFEPRAVGYDPGWYVVQRHSASECIAKIRQYELFRDGRISSEDAR